MLSTVPVSVLPNVLTVARIIAVVPLVWLIVNEHYVSALGLALLAGVTDVLDGYLARRFAWESHFGGWADPAADKLMMTASYLTLTYVGALPIWLMGLVVGRDLVIASGALAYRAIFGRFRALPTRLSKLTTLAQIILVWLSLIHLAQWMAWPGLQQALIWSVGGLTIMTLLQYVSIWGRKAWVHGRQAKEVS